MSKKQPLREHEAVMLSRICESSSRADGRLFMVTEVLTADPKDRLAIAGLLYLGLLTRRVYSGGGVRYKLSTEGRVYVAYYWPPPFFAYPNDPE